MSKRRATVTKRWSQSGQVTPIETHPLPVTCDQRFYGIGQIALGHTIRSWPQHPIPLFYQVTGKIGLFCPVPALSNLWSPKCPIFVVRYLGLRFFYPLFGIGHPIFVVRYLNHFFYFSLGIGHLSFVRSSWLDS